MSNMTNLWLSGVFFKLVFGWDSPRTHLGELTTLPRLPSRLDTHSTYPSPPRLGARLSAPTTQIPGYAYIAEVEDERNRCRPGI